MRDTDFSLDTFGATFKAFMDAMVTQASAGLASPLLDRIRTHVGVEPTQLPVIAEEFDTFEHPNLQVAMEDFLERPGRLADLVGVAAENKRFMALSLSDLLGRRSGLAEGPVDYVNFHLAGDRVLSCVEFRAVFHRRRRPASDRLCHRSIRPRRSAHARESRSDRVQA